MFTDIHPQLIQYLSTQPPPSDFTGPKRISFRKRKENRRLPGTRRHNVPLVSQVEREVNKGEVGSRERVPSDLLKYKTYGDRSLSYVLLCGTESSLLPSKTRFHRPVYVQSSISLFFRPSCTDVDPFLNTLSVSRRDTASVNYEWFNRYVREGEGSGKRHSDPGTLVNPLLYSGRHYIQGRSIPVSSEPFCKVERGGDEATGTLGAHSNLVTIKVQINSDTDSGATDLCLFNPTSTT